MLLPQRRAWGLDEPIFTWLPGAPRSEVSMRRCLRHTAGLVWHQPFFAVQQSPPAIKAAVLAELGAAVPGPICYSDLSFMLLGWAVENCAGEALTIRPPGRRWLSFSSPSGQLRRSLPPGPTITCSASASSAAW